MEKSIKDLAKEAIDVQDACNLSGVVHSFSRAMTELRGHFPGVSTHELNRHPIAVMYADKIADLTESRFPGEFSNAYKWCVENSKQT